MIVQAAGFAFLAAISPTALLVLAVYLGSAEPRRTAGMYLAGAMVISVVMAVVLLIAVRSIGLNVSAHRTARYGVRLALGVLALAAAAFLRWRARRPAPVPAADAGAPGQQRGLVSRLVTEPSPMTAFLAGLLIFSPGVTFIAAVQVIATAGASPAATAVALIVIVAVYLIIIWVPMLAFLLSPGLTTRKLKVMNAWLRTHGKKLAVAALAVGGVILVLNGINGLVA